MTPKWKVQSKQEWAQIDKRRQETQAERLRLEILLNKAEADCAEEERQLQAQERALSRQQALVGKVESLGESLASFRQNDAGWLDRASTVTVEQLLSECEHLVEEMRRG